MFETSQGVGSHERNRHPIQLSGSVAPGVSAIAAALAGGGPQPLPRRAKARAIFVTPAPPAPMSNTELVDLTRDDLRVSNHGADVRQQYTVNRKCQVISWMLDPSNIGRFGQANMATAGADFFHVPKVCIYRWMKDKDKLMAHRNDSLFKVSPERAAKFARAESMLLQQVLVQREKKRPVTALFLKLAMRRLVAEVYPDDDLEQYKFSNMWVLRFARRNNLSRRVSNSCKHAPNSERVPVIQRFHQELRALLKAHTEHPPLFEDEEEEEVEEVAAAAGGALASVDAYPSGAGKRKPRAVGVPAPKKAARGSLAIAFAKAGPKQAGAGAVAEADSGIESGSCSSSDSTCSESSAEALDDDASEDPNDLSMCESLADYERFGVKVISEPPAAVNKSLVGSHVLRFINDEAKWNYAPADRVVGGAKR